MNWSEFSLSELCDVRRGTTITQLQTRPGNIPVVGGGMTPTYFHDTSNRSGNVITVSASGANAGYVNFWTKPIFASDCSTVTTSREDIDIKYVFYFLRSQQTYINSKLRSGAAQPHVYAKDIAQLRLQVPPIDAQRRITTILDQADMLRVKRREALMQLDRLTQSIFFEMFGDPASNPKAWPRLTLDDLMNANGPQNGLYKPSTDYGIGTPILRIDAFYDGVVTKLDSLKRVRLSASEQSLYGLRAEDIVINRVNSIEYLGKSALIPKLPEPTVFESNMMRFAVKRDVVEPGYIIQFLQTQFIKSQILSCSKNAVNQSSINQQDVKSFQINVPSLKLQKIFSARTAAIDALKTTHRSALTQLDAFFACLQHRAFQGEL